MADRERHDDPPRELTESELGVVRALHAAAETERAPDRLRAAIAREQAAARAPRARRRVVLGGGLAAVAAVLVLALVLILPSGTPGAPSVSQAAALAGRGIAAPAPAPDPSAPGTTLDHNVGSVYFPDWDRTFHWHAVGQRSDRIGGRIALTVYYAWHHHQIAYTIVDSPALALPDGSVVRIRGEEYRTLTVGSRLVVTWRRRNHTCVLSGVGVPARVLRELAAWRAPGEAS